MLYSLPSGQILPSLSLLDKEGGEESQEEDGEEEEEKDNLAQCSCSQCLLSTRGHGKQATYEAAILP